MSTSDLTPDAYLSPPELAAALSRLGLPTSAATLAAWRGRGEGPPFTRWGHAIRYAWGPCWAWAQARLGLPLPVDRAEAHSAANGEGIAADELSRIERERAALPSVATIS